MAAQDYFDLIRSFNLFKSCSDDFVRSFASAVSPRKAAEGVAILTQGQKNTELFILCSGKVVILVDDESVAVLGTPGDPIGEISVLLSREATATVVPQTAVEYLAIDVTDLEKFIAAAPGDFGYQLFRAFANVLSEKIVRTNDKARRFELANRTLDAKVKERTADLQKKTDELENRNGELIASHRKLEELYSTKEVTFKKLIELQSQYLEPLMETFKEIEPTIPTQATPKFERAKAQIEGSISMLRPVSELYSTEQAMRSRRVLLVEKDRKQQTLAKMALGGTGVHLDIAASIEEATEFLNGGGKFDLAFVSSEMASLIPEIKKSSPNVKLVFMASSNVPAELPILKQYSADISNIVSRHPEDRTFTVKNVATTVAKLVANDFFGLEKYMIWGVEVQEKVVSKSNERDQLIDGMSEYFRNLGMRSTICEKAATVAEEILMNAIYDAPIKDGKSRYNQLDRKQMVELEKNEFATFRYACDGMLAAVSVSDPFGGFKMDTLLTYLGRNYSGDSQPQDAGKGGAGRGLHQIIESSDLVVFNIHRNRRTEVIALFNIDPKSVVEDAKPSFHFFRE